MNNPMFIKPWVICLVGLPGSGKSTFYNDHSSSAFNSFDVTSTDDIIEQYARSVNKTYSEVFNEYIGQATTEMKLHMRDLITYRQSFFVDQTNLSRKKRESLIQQVGNSYYKICIVVECDEELRQERLKCRPGKIIPPEVDANMIKSFQPPVMDEGWNQIEYIKSSGTSLDYI